ncbi:probable serine/threonine-protein kinase Nek1 at N-terminal half [Coccomyxa sp. Obi]|nr:probable serine/threonine-protein kinase Nek1 at N-terminal half [Coccomyxa sp. Obi]
MTYLGSDAADAPSFEETDGVCTFKPQDFKDSMVIGKGKDCVVYSAYCQKLEGRRVAVKVYEKSKLSASKLRAVKREAAMMIYMTRKRVPLITQFHGAFQDAYQIFLVMEYCGGGDLLERLLKEGRAMSERRVILEVAVPLLKTLQHMHSYSIIHRDVKLENVFIANDGRVRLGDFGLTMSMKQEMAISPVGTVEYMAPEVVALPPVEAVISGAVKTSDIAACTEKVDIWALGVTLYELLTGHLPFEGRDKTEIKAAITAGHMRPFSAALSPACASFVGSMMVRDAKVRPSARQLLQHPIVLGYTRVAQPPQPVQPPATPQPATPPLLSAASMSDSVSSVECGNIPSHPINLTASGKRPTNGAQGTITISIGGSRGGALSGSFSINGAQAATSAPEVAPHHLPAHTLVLEGSGGSLIKARHAAFECLSGGTPMDGGSSASSSDMFNNRSSGSNSSAEDSIRAASGRNAGTCSRPSSPLLHDSRLASGQGAGPQRLSGACGRRSMHHEDSAQWPQKTRRSSLGSTATAASGAQLMKAPSPIVMSKQLQDGGDTFMAGVSPPEAHNLAHQLLPPRPPPGPPAADEDAAGAGLMTRVTSLFNRALCKPSSRMPPVTSAYVEDRHPSLYAAHKQLL